MTSDLNKIPSKEKCHILLDQETLSLKPDAAVTELAAICYNSGASFSVTINPATYPADKVSMDQATIDWHNSTNGANYVALLTQRGHHATDAAQAFIGWLKGQAGEQPVQIWTQGTDFDIPVLRNFLALAGLELPCQHDQVRDFRTLASLFPEVNYIKGSHSALDDVSKMHQHLYKLITNSPLVEAYFVNLNWDPIP